MEKKEEELIEVLKSFTLEDIFKIEEKIDRQYLALKKLYLKLENKNIFPVLVIFNSLVSYQLNTYGENYWEEFSKYFSINQPKIKKEETNKEKCKKLFNLFKEFLLNSKGNRRFLNSKIKRLEKFLSVCDKIMKNSEYFYENQEKLLELLSKTMNQKKEAKTLVFSIKMFGYSMRIKTKERKMFSFNIAIPLDSRIKRITKNFTNKDPILFWFKVSKIVNIPPLHLDSLIWLLYREKEETFLKHFPKKGEKIKLLKKLIIIN